MKMSKRQIDLLLGLDDLAHTRLLTSNKDWTKFKKIAGYGKRNKEYTCYCRALRKLRVSK